jgi:hypothetical protein
MILSSTTRTCISLTSSGTGVAVCLNTELDEVNRELLDSTRLGLCGVTSLLELFASCSARAPTESTGLTGGATVQVLIKKRKTDPSPSCDWTSILPPSS